MGFGDFIKPGWKHSDPEFRLKSVRRIKSNLVLFDVYSHDSDYHVRKAAVERMTDQQKLCEIVYNEPDAAIRLVAVWKIDDEAVLQEVATNDPDHNISQAATWKQSDSALANQMKNAARYQKRKAAMEKLSGAILVSDQTLLEDVAKNDRLAKTRIDAVKNLKDQVILAEIAENDVDDGVRSLAKAKITDKNILNNLPKYRYRKNWLIAHYKITLIIFLVVFLAVLYSYILPAYSIYSAEQNIFSTNKNNRNRAFQLLLKNNKERFIAFLIRKIHSTDDNTVKYAVAAYEKTGAKPKTMVSLFVNGLKNKDSKIKVIFIQALGRIGQDAETSVPVLIKELEIKNSKIRLNVIKALGKIAPDKQTTVTAIIKMLEDRENSIRQCAIEALVKIGRPVIPILIKELTDNTGIRKNAVTVLQGIGKPAVPFLIKLLNHWDHNVRKYTIGVLLKIAPYNEHVIQALVKLLGDANPAVRLTAVEALGKIGPVAKVALPALLKTLNDPSKNVRESTVNSFDKISKYILDDSSYQTVLIDLAKNAEYPDTRKAAVKKIVNQTVWANVAQNDKSYSVRKATYLLMTKNDLGKLTNQTYITDVAQNDKSYSVRQAAYLRITKNDLGKLTNQTYIADVAKNDENWSNRKAAVKKLTDQTMLVDVVKNTMYLDACKAAVAKLTNQAMLSDIAKNARKSYAREAVVDKLTDQILLADIAKNDVSSAVRVAAVLKLADRSILADYAANAQDKNVRMSAVIRLSGHSLVYVSPGSFQMGSNNGMRFERPVHEVTLSHGYGIGKYEVAQSEYQSIMGNNPSRFIGSSNPVERVSWHDATKFCEKLTARERTAGRLPTGFEYRLPTEAEWEFAARGGVKSKGYKYSGSDNIDSVAWYSGNSGVNTRKVGRKKPNELGIYDMNGNVWEWCRDWYGQYPNKSMIDPTGPSTGSRRVFRGGDVFFFAGGCHSTFRSFYTMSHIPDLLGFRIVLSNSSL